MRDFHRVFRIGIFCLTVQFLFFPLVASAAESNPSPKSEIQMEVVKDSSSDGPVVTDPKYADFVWRARHRAQYQSTQKGGLR